MENLSIFSMAELQLQKEVRAKLRKKYKTNDIFDYAIKIRNYLDIAPRNKKVANIRWGNKIVSC